MRDFVELIESLDYQALLFENRAEFLIQTYGAKLEAKWAAEGESEPSSVQSGVAAQPVETIPEKVISYIASFDPTLKKIYTQWMVTRYLKGGMRLEDLEAAKDGLERFTEMKQQRLLPANQTDINSCKSLADLSVIVQDAHQAVISSTDAQERAMLAQAKVIYNGPDCSILIPTTQEAACYFGRNTGWCTAWGYEHGRHPGRSNHYEHYAKDGPLYIIDVKPDHTMYQYHSESAQFKDVNDHELSAEAVKALLKAHPKILTSIGETAFVNSHLRAFGLSFFSPAVIAKADPKKITSAIHTARDLAALPKDMLHDPKFLAQFAVSRPSAYESLKEARDTGILTEADFSPEMAAVMRELVANRAGFYPVFDLFPISEWPLSVIEHAASQGTLTYQKFMEQPEDQRSEAQLKKLIEVTAAKHPDLIASYPPGLIGRLGASVAIVERNHKVMEYLSPEDLTEDDLVKLADAEFFSGNYSDIARLGYLDPARVTDRVVAAMNAHKNQYDTKLEAGPKLEEQIRYQWVASLMRPDWRGQINFEEKLKPIPRRYESDPTFFADVMDMRLNPRAQTRATSPLEYWLNQFFRTIPETMVSADMLTTLVDKVAIRSEHSVYSSSRSSISEYSMSLSDAKGVIRRTLLKHEPLWTNDIVSNALMKKILNPGDVPTERMTPSIAAEIFALDPTNVAAAYKADDASLEKKINASYQPQTLTHAIPNDRYTEPLAFAAVKKGYVADAKKRFPPKTLSQRVYMAGVPSSFSLKDVPKKWRTDDLVTKAVSADAGQLKFVPEPLHWLNAHKDALSKAQTYWEFALQSEGFIKTIHGFERITDLPHDTVKGYDLYRAQVDKKEQRWFLTKGDRRIATMDIKNGKLKLANENPTADLEPTFREIATKYLTNVSDITILNKIGIYRNSDGSIRDESENYAKSEKKTVEGIDWTDSPHLKGKLYTAWKDGKPLLSAYIAASGGWGGGYNKLQSVKIIDQKTSLENAKQLEAGFYKLRFYGVNAYDLRNIGLQPEGKNGMWLAADQKIGSVGKYTVYYAKSHRFISIYGPTGLVAHGTLLKSGALTKDQVNTYTIPKKDREKDGATLQKILTSMAEKVGAVKKP